MRRNIYSFSVAGKRYRPETTGPGAHGKKWACIFHGVKVRHDTLKARLQEIASILEVSGGSVMRWFGASGAERDWTKGATGATGATGVLSEDSRGGHGGGRRVRD
jgi:hypothetical protein